MRLCSRRRSGSLFAADVIATQCPPAPARSAPIVAQHPPNEGAAQHASLPVRSSSPIGGPDPLGGDAVGTGRWHGLVHGLGPNAGEEALAAARNEAQSQPGGVRSRSPGPSAGIARYLVTRYSSIPSGSTRVAEARVTDAAERGRDAGDPAAIDAHHPGLEAPPTRIARSRSDVKTYAASPDSWALARAKRLVVALERRDRHDRPEDLLAHDARVGRNVGQDDRREEVPSAGTGPPDRTMRAPRATASSTSSARRATWRAEIIGPSPRGAGAAAEAHAATRAARRRVNSAYDGRST